MNYHPNCISVGTPKDEETAHKLIVSSLKAGSNVVELGCLKGWTSSIMCKANRNVNVYSIDPLIPDSMNLTLKGSIDEININTEGCNNFHFINDYSYNVAKTWNKEISYLFIDASHLENDVRRDLNDWYPFVVKGGIISLHDSAMSEYGRGGPNWWNGSTIVANEMIDDDRFKCIKTVFSLTIFKKVN